MDEMLTRFLENLVGRLHGPMLFRLILQPLSAIIFAIRDGSKDGREGRALYFWSLFTERGHRLDLLRHGWKSVGKVFVFAVIIDAVYQFITVRWFYPGEAVVVAFVLAIVPYLMLELLSLVRCCFKTLRIAACNLLHRQTLRAVHYDRALNGLYRPAAITHRGVAGLTN